METRKNISFIKNIVFVCKCNVTVTCCTRRLKRVLQWNWWEDLAQIMKEQQSWGGWYCGWSMKTWILDDRGNMPAEGMWRDKYGNQQTDEVPWMHKIAKNKDCVIEHLRELEGQFPLMLMKKERGKILRYLFLWNTIDRCAFWCIYSLNKLLVKTWYKALWLQTCRTNNSYLKEMTADFGKR